MDEPWLEKVGTAEPCDWCGRPGIVRQHDYYEAGRLRCRNPSLCDVCSTLWDVSGDVADAFYDSGVDPHTVVEVPMEKVLFAKWLAKVDAGIRSPGSA